MRLPKGYYVYGHKDMNTGNWIYIGKGKNGRAFEVSSRRPHHAIYLQENEIEVVIFIDGLTEEESFELEAQAIRELVVEHGYRLGDKGEKVLLNVMVAGGGNAKTFHAQKTKDKMKKNNNSKRAVICVETGEIYESTVAAQEATGVPRRTISKCCSGDRKHGENKLKGGGTFLHFKYLHEDEKDRPAFVRCVETGDEFVSLNKAAAWCGLSNGWAISRQLLGYSATAGGYHWEYI